MGGAFGGSRPRGRSPRDEASADRKPDEGERGKDVGFAVRALAPFAPSTRRTGDAAFAS
ncbi:hypothetical protein Sdia_51370 [Streptomyces diastaticus subsp. diastaticus]|uniref:Uncharacterized protein n=1 Tax=Streptomyces diastaticus subsp. diastaticus TaxID=68040 RepID=A0ABQ1CVL5_STRDI|nr:hypothetical protein Sdia_51370 [Streptomyces diastaticus subsp. diastaticus]GGU02555.1 hypothetical protein GCM10015534_00080 [Streptomyces diastaticus subsp. diastaticus]